MDTNISCRLGLSLTFWIALLTLSCGSSSSSLAPSTISPDEPPISLVGWPNEPQGMTTMTDRVWTDLVGDGWNRRDSTWDRIATDSSVPSPPPVALEYVYPSGFQGGSAPATQYYELGGAKELYIGLQWRVSSPWQGHSSYVNKIQFLYSSLSDVAMVMYGPSGGPYDIRVLVQQRGADNPWLTPNVGPGAPSLGRWHRIEWYLKYETAAGARNGIVRWWLDNTQVGDYRNISFGADDGFSEYQISPTWGGVGDTKNETDYYRFARTYISSRPLR